MWSLRRCRWREVYWDLRRTEEGRRKCGLLRWVGVVAGGVAAAVVEPAVVVVVVAALAIAAAAALLLS